MNRALDLPESVVMAYLDEPPFCWRTAAGEVVGADIEVAREVLHAIGLELGFVLADFANFIPGVVAGRWTMNVPMFVTAERANSVLFSRPVWALADGVMVRAGDPKALVSYRAIAESTSMLGVVDGQVQQHTAAESGVPVTRIRAFTHPGAAIEALLDRRIDAYASAAVVLRGLLEKKPDPRLAFVDFAVSGEAPVVKGAYSFAYGSVNLRSAFDSQLARFLGSSRHIEIMRRYGLLEAVIVSP